MKIVATPIKIENFGHTSGTVITRFNEKDYVCDYRIHPYFFQRSQHNQKEKRELTIRFPQIDSLKDFGIEVDFNKTKYFVIRSILKQIKEEERKHIEKRSDEYDASPAHTILKDLTNLLGNGFTYNGQTYTPKFQICTKENFCKGHYSANDIAVEISYKQKDSQNKDRVYDFTVTRKYSRQGYWDGKFSFKQGYTNMKGQWARLDKIALKIEKMVKDFIDSIERSYKAIEEKNQYVNKSLNELGAGFTEEKGTFSYRKSVPHDDPNQAKYYEKEWKVSFCRSENNEKVRYYRVNLAGYYTLEQLKKIVEIGMAAEPENVWKTK